MAAKMQWDKDATAYDAVADAVLEKCNGISTDFIVRIRTKYEYEDESSYIESNELLIATAYDCFEWSNDWWEGEQDVWLVAAIPVHDLEPGEKWTIFESGVNGT